MAIFLFKKFSFLFRASYGACLVGGLHVEEILCEVNIKRDRLSSRSCTKEDFSESTKWSKQHEENTLCFYYYSLYFYHFKRM